MTDIGALAITYIRELKSLQFTTSSETVPLRVKQELTVDIIRMRYQRRDEVSLILEPREYIKGRLPVNDRATAVAISL